MRDGSIEDVVAAASSGDRAAWRELVQRYAGTVWTAARSLQLSEQDAEDVSQITWLLLAVQIRALKDPATVGAWLTSTARRESLRLIRSRRREVPADHDPPAPVDRSPGRRPDVVLGTELRAVVRSAFLDLPEYCRRLLAMLTRTRRRRTWRSARC